MKDRRLVYFPVRRPMTVTEVAAFFEVSPGQVGVWNGIDPNVPLVRGMALRMYIPKTFDRSRVILIPPERVMKVPARTPGAIKALARSSAKTCWTDSG